MSMDNGMDVSPSWQELKDERDALSAKVAELEAAIKFQASAAKRGMNAAKEHGAHMEAEARRLHAECSPEALESERQANAQLTVENEALAAHVERMRDVWQRLHLRSPVHVEVLKAYSHVMRDTPTTSLARLIAEKQAEAYEDGAGIIRKDAPVSAEQLDGVAKLKRRQAEGGSGE